MTREEAAQYMKQLTLEEKWLLHDFIDILAQERPPLPTMEKTTQEHADQDTSSDLQTKS